MAATMLMQQSAADGCLKETPVGIINRNACLAYLKIAADGELVSEQAKRSLIELLEFVPSEAFRAVEGFPAKGYISVRDVHSWLTDQPRRRLPSITQQDIAEFLLPHCPHGELTYEGFVKLVLPRETPGARSLTLRSFYGTNPVAGRGACDHTAPSLHANVAQRLRELLEVEIELAQHLHANRKMLQVSPDDAFTFLSSLTPVVPLAPNTGFLSMWELRLGLVDRLGVLDAPQCDALFNRASHYSSNGLSCEDLARLLRPFGAGQASPLDGAAPREIGMPPSLQRVALEKSRRPKEEDAPVWNDTPRPPAPTPRGAFRTIDLQERGRQNPGLMAVLFVIDRQGHLDEYVEEVKLKIPVTTPLEAMFGALDIDHKGYITDQDLWRFVQSNGGNLTLPSIAALILELQNGRRHDSSAATCQLSLRELGALVHPKGTLEHGTMDGATTDHEARSTLYLKRFTEPCPGCGIRIQRDADAVGCPSVTCPVCRKTFHCYTVMGQEGDRDMHSGQILEGGIRESLFQVALSPAEREALRHTIEASAATAEEIESLRKHIPLSEGPQALTDVFALWSDGRGYLVRDDFRRGLTQYRSVLSERATHLVWHRYARGSKRVTLEVFLQHLTPLMGPAKTAVPH